LVVGSDGRRSAMGAAARCIIQASRPEWELLTTRVCAQNCRERESRTDHATLRRDREARGGGGGG
jgi:hypothetical protein